MKYTLEIELDLPREEAASLFAHRENYRCWQPGFVRIQHLNGGRGRAGERLRLFYDHGKGEVEVLETVEVERPPEEFTSTFEVQGMVVRVQNLFQEVSPGRTRWTSHNDARASGFKMHLATSIVPGGFKRQSLALMKNFKAFAEQGADLRKPRDDEASPES